MASADDKKWQRDAADQNFDYMFKLLIIGNSATGKTSLLFRYADDSFTSAFVSTVGIDFKVKTVFRNEKRVKLQIWDTGINVCFSLSLWNLTDEVPKSMRFVIPCFSWTRTLSHYNNSLLSGSNGLYSAVRYYKRRIIPSRSRLVSPTFNYKFTRINVLAPNCTYLDNAFRCYLCWITYYHVGIIATLVFIHLLSLLQLCLLQNSCLPQSTALRLLACL